MVIEPSQPAEMADVDSEVDSEVVRQHAVWSGWGGVAMHYTSPLNAYSTYSMQFSGASFSCVTVLV